MSSQEAREEWGPVLPRSTNHQVSNSVTLTYRWYIPGIYQVYTNVGDIHGIYQGYTLYLLGIYQVYTLALVYTWYIVGKYLVYTVYMSM